ncbi:putative ribonuclease H-like domain-containing protein [Tanacetum coccineum]
MRPFGCPVTILNIIDHLGKFDGKADEGFFVGYSLNSKAFRVFNSRTRIVEENLHIRFSESTKCYSFAGTKASDNASQARKETEPVKDYILLPLWTANLPFSQIIEFADDGSNFNSIVNDAGTNEVNVVDDEDDDAVADMNNLDTTIQVSPILTTRIHKYHSLHQVIGDLQSATQTRKMSKNLEEHGFVSTIQNCLFACFLSQEEPKRNKKDERGIAIRNKARLVAQGYTQEEGIGYDEVFATFTRIEAIMLFLAYASFKDFIVYQMDVKSAFLYGKIEEEVYVCQPPGFEDPDFPDKVYKVEKALYGLHQAPRAWYETLSTYLLDNGFQRGKIDKTLFIKRHKDKVVHKELGDSWVRVATTASSLEAEQDSGGGHRCQVTMGDIIAQTRFENVSKHSNDSLLARGNTLRNDEGRLKLKELMALSRVESFDDEESLSEDASKQGRIDASDADEEITLVSVHDEMEVDKEVVEVINTAKLIIDAAQVSAAGDKVSAASVATTVSAATTTTATTVDDITLAQALKEMKSTKPKTKGVVIQELGESTTTKSLQLSSQQSHDKGKGIWIEPVKLMKNKDQISFDEETTLKLQAEFNKEERFAREKAEKEQEANIALIETWDDL